MKGRKRAELTALPPFPHPTTTCLCCLPFSSLTPTNLLHVFINALTDYAALSALTWSDSLILCFQPLLWHYVVLDYCINMDTTPRWRCTMKLSWATLSKYKGAACKSLVFKWSVSIHACVGGFGASKPVLMWLLKWEWMNECSKVHSTQHTLYDTVQHEGSWQDSARTSAACSPFQEVESTVGLEPLFFCVQVVENTPLWPCDCHCCRPHALTHGPYRGATT